MRTFAVGNEHPRRFSQRVVWSHLELQHVRQKDDIHGMGVDGQRRRGTGCQRIETALSASVDVDYGAAQDAARAHEVRAGEVSDLQAMISEQIADRGVHPLNFGGK